MLSKFITKLSHAVARENPRRFSNIICIYGVLLLPLLFVVVVSFCSVYKNATSLSLSQQRNVGFPVALALTNRINQVIDDGKGIVIHPQFLEFVLLGKYHEAMEVTKIFNHINEEPFIDRIALLNPQGILMSSSPEVTTVGQDFSYRDWYNGVVKTAKPYVSEVYRRAVEPQYNVVSIAIPVTDEQNLLSAILVLQIKIDHFLDWLETIDVGDGGLIYVVDQYGNVVAHPEIAPQDSIVSLSNYPIVQNLLRGHGGQEMSLDPINREERVLVSYEPVPEHGWGIVIQQPINDVFFLREKAIKSLLLLYGVVLIINVLLIYLMVLIFTHYQDHKDLNINSKPFKPTKV